MTTHTYLIEASDLGVDLRLRFRLTDLRWEPRDDEPGGWQGKAILVSASIGRLRLNPGDVVSLLADPEETDHDKAISEAILRLYRLTKLAWDEWLLTDEAQDPFGFLTAADDAHHEEGLR